LSLQNLKQGKWQEGFAATVDVAQSFSINFVASVASHAQIKLEMAVNHTLHTHISIY
jgi:hypothetical protein